MKELKGSKTEQNLMAAFAAESQARNKYTYYASQAEKDGYRQIADIFRLTASNEEQHAKIWFKLLNNGTGNTKDNLADAAHGERFEWTEMYATFARQAREEGFDREAALFEGVAKIEKEHEERFLALHSAVEKGTVFSKTPETVWICRNCGHIHIGKQPPEYCPVCSHDRSYFEIKAENY